MKQRTGFVANSSSSSFLIVTLGDKELYNDDESGWMQEEFGISGSHSIPIDELIGQLLEAKAKGVTHLSFEYGGGYNG